MTFFGAGLVSPTSQQLKSEVLEHAVCRVVSGGTDDRACRMRAGRTEVETGDTETVWSAIVEAKTVVDVVYVAVGDSEMPLNPLRRKREAINHKV